MAIDRRPSSDKRKLRALAQHAVLGLADGSSITLDGGAYTIALDTNSGLQKTSGLKIKLDTNPGLVLGSGGLKVLLDTNPGLVLGAGGLKTLLDGDSLILGAGGLKVKLDGSSGLTISTGLKVLLQADSGLALGETGLKLAGPEYQTAADLTSSTDADYVTVWTVPVAASGTWYFDAVVFVSGDDLSGIIINVSGPTDSSCILMVDGATADKDTRSLDILSGVLVTPGHISPTTYAAFTGNSAIVIRGQIKTGTTAGNFRLNFKTLTDGVDVNVLAGSYAVVRKV